MYHPRLYGTFYEMGHKYGSLLEKNGFKLSEIPKEKTEFGIASYAELYNFYPELIEEIEGFAGAIHEKPEKLGAFLLSLISFDLTAQCSVFAVKDGNSVMAGRNYDMLYAFKKFTESSLIAPKNKYAYISQSDVFIGRCDGLNEKGLFVAMSFVNGTKIQPGISFHIIIRKVLENCQNVEEAIRVIQGANVSSSNNFLLADRMGNRAVVESAPQKSIVRKPEKGENFIFITNQFVTPEMAPFDRGGVAWSKSGERFNALQKHLEGNGPVTLQTVKDILSDNCVCLDLKKEKFGTIWSVATHLNDLTLERAETKPKSHNFKPDTRLAWWLNKRKTL